MSQQCFRWVLAALACTTWASPSFAGCAGLRTQFDRAVADRSVERAKQLETSIKVDPICSSRALEIRNRRVELEIALASEPGTALLERESLLADAVKVPDSWRAAWKFADLRMQQRRFAEAAALYDQAIQRAGTPAPFADGEKLKLLKAAAAAKNLASDDKGGVQRVAFAESTRGPDGSVGGVFAPSMRAIVPVAVPLPINFETDRASLTPNGSKAADELLKAIREQKVSEVTLVGHTDERGSDEYNMQLSLARVRRVAEYLQQRLGSEGASVHFNLVAKGKREPFDASVLSFKPSQEEVWALDRRVDWLR